MNDKKTIAVLGATGAQGGGLARAVLNDSNSEFAVRALTRDASSDKARVLADLGAEVVIVDVDDAQSLKNAYEGAYGAFCVTFFWEHFSADKEIEQARSMAAAAKDAGLKHVIWSTFEDTRKWVPLDDDRMPTLMEKYKVPHFDGKGEANGAFTEAGVPTTFLLTSFYWENFINLGLGPKVDADGNLAITLPMDDKKMPGISAEDIGRCAYGIFKAGQEFIGKTVGIAGGHLTGKEMADAMGAQLGRAIHYNAVPPEVFRGFGFPGAEDLGNMFQFKCDFEDYYCGARDIDFTRSLNPELLSFDAWLAANKELIPLE